MILEVQIQIFVKRQYATKFCVFEPKGYNIVNAARGERTCCLGMVSAA